MSERRKGYIAAISYSCIIGFSFLAVKTALSNANTPILLAHRFTVAFFAALIVALIRRIDVRIRPRDFLKLLPLSLFYPVLYFSLQSMGLARMSSSIAGILQSTAPVFAMIFSALILKERSTGIQFVGVLLTIGGVALLSLNSVGTDGNEPLGSVLIILSALAYGLYSVLSRKRSRQYPVFTMTFWMLAIGFVLFNLYAVFTPIDPISVSAYFTPLTEGSYLVAVLYLGILSSLLSAYLSNYALARMEAAKMSVFGSLATLISVAAGVIILSEPFHGLLIAGMAIIAAGVLMVNLGKTVNQGETLK